ncbi:hypothetical protein PIB30_035636 [Stylosanthes scabra]|uniref:PB1-like domain-containing protein n=1 Tax=Stylosanthes scabra TaxID=79078 RepID=A0ABU6ZAR2_9FABA|nr:hypothetical protein [Stylosanthes scabra]
MDSFSVMVNHSGKFREKVGRGKYVDVEKEIVDWCDRDKWSLLEVYDMLEKIGYLEENIDSLWYKIGGLGLKKLCVDRDAMELANVGVVKGLIELYVVHKLSVPVPDEFSYEIEYIDVEGGANVGNEADCGPSVGVEAQHAANIGPGVGVEAHNGVDCGPNVILEAQNIEVEIQGVAEFGVKSDRVGQGAVEKVDIKGDSDYEEDLDYEEDSDLYFSDSEDDFCGDDALFDVEITLGELQEEIKVNKQAKAKKTIKKKGKETAGVRASSGQSDDEGINSDELEELQSEDGDDEDGTKVSHKRKFPIHKEEFKDDVVTYAVHSETNIKFSVVNNRRVRAKCEAECRRFAYAVKISSEESRVGVSKFSPLRGSSRGTPRMRIRRREIFPVGTGNPQPQMGNGKSVVNGEFAKNGDGEENSPMAGNGAGTGRDFKGGDREREGIPRPLLAPLTPLELAAKKRGESAHLWWRFQHKNDEI